MNNYRRGQNCAIALAIKDIFPDSWVGAAGIDIDYNGIFNKVIDLPEEVIHFIKEFDKNSPEQRIDMTSISFDIEIPNNVVETINIEDIKPLLINHPTLQLVD